MSKPRARPIHHEAEPDPSPPNGSGPAPGEFGPNISFHAGMVVVNVTVDVRDAHGHKINERTMPAVSLNYPHGEKLEQVIRALVAQAAQEYQD